MSEAQSQAKDAARARAHDLIDRGYQAQLEGRTSLAKACLRESLAVAPTALAHALLGWALAAEGRIDQAIAQCLASIRLDPGLGNAWSDIGAYLLEKGQDRAARGYLERALEMKRFERHHYAHGNLGRVYRRQGLLGKALDEFRIALALEPRDSAAKKAIREILRIYN